MRSITWAIRVTFADGRSAFLRQGGITGHGAIRSFPSKEQAEAEAVVLRAALDARDTVTVIERSHGRRD